MLKDLLVAVPTPVDVDVNGEFCTYAGNSTKPPADEDCNDASGTSENSFVVEAIFISPGCRGTGIGSGAGGDVGI